MMEHWNLKTTGILEYWNGGIVGLKILFFVHHSNIPSFHYSFFISAFICVQKIQSFEFGVKGSKALFLT